MAAAATELYRKEQSIPLRSSSAALYNNLSVLRLPGGRLAGLSAVHGPSLSLLSAAADGLGFSHRQLQAKEGGMAVSTSLLTQAAWCVLPARVLLVLTSQRGIQMYESDGSIMVYWHALDVAEHSPARAVFARGIAAAGGRFICVGTSSGLVLVFDIPPKGTNVTVSEVLEQHRDAITDIAAELGQAPDGAGDLVSADDAGALCVWSTGEEFTLLSKIPAFGCSCSSVKLWNGIVAAGYGNGQIRLYEAATGVLRAEVNAHARWIYALDLAPQTGKVRHRGTIAPRPAAPRSPQPPSPPPVAAVGRGGFLRPRLEAQQEPGHRRSRDPAPSRRVRDRHPGLRRPLLRPRGQLLRRHRLRPERDLPLQPGVGRRAGLPPHRKRGGEGE